MSAAVKDGFPECCGRKASRPSASIRPKFSSSKPVDVIRRAITVSPVPRNSHSPAPPSIVASYLTLIDIPDVSKAISEMARVLKPGGRLLIANLTGFGTAGDGWSDEPEPRFCIDRYLEIRELLSEWKGIRITNWHRPLSYYMQLLLCEGLILRHFDEPPAHGGDPATVAKYDRVPWLMMMEWEKH